MAHHWTPEEIAETIRIAVLHPRRGEARDDAAEEFADAVTAATPHNPLTVSAAKYAIDVARGAWDAWPGMAYGASDELRRQIAALRQAEDQPGQPPPPALGVEERRIELAIDACLAFPKEELENRQAVFRDLGLEVPSARYFEGVDNAIDGILTGTVKPSEPVKRRVELRRRSGVLVRRY